MCLREDAGVAQSVTSVVVVGVDGAGRTHRLGEIAAARTSMWLGVAGEPPPPLADLLASARAEGRLLVVDDAHRLPGSVLSDLVAAARTGVDMAIARRPTIDRPELAEFDDAVAARGRVELLAPLDSDAVAALLARATGRAPEDTAVAAVLAASAGLPAIATALADGFPDPAPPALVAWVQRRLARLDRSAVALAGVLALRLDLPDEVLAAAAELPVDQLGSAARSLRDAGMLAADRERIVPAVAEVILADLPPTGRRRIHEAVARSMLATRADPALTAKHLRAARIRTPTAAQIYRAAGEQLRLAEPGAAIGWYDDAAEAGADPVSLAAGRAEAAALLGLPVETHVAAPAPDAGRAALVEGAVAAHQGRPTRAAAALLAAPHPGPLLAVPSLMATGQLEQARTAAAAAVPAPACLVRFAEAALNVGDPAIALPLLIEAAEAVEAVPPPVVLPDTPHALGALVAVAAGDAASAEHLLGRALVSGVGGPVAVNRHRLLLAWVRLRTGRYDSAAAELRDLDGALPSRERLLRAALAAGLARRSGNVASLRDTWSGVEQVLARGAIDLFEVEAIEEFAVAAVRLRQSQRVAPLLDSLDETVCRLGSPPAWAVAVGWVRLQMAIAVEDVAGADDAAVHLSAVATTGDRQRTLCAAARSWARALAGDVDGESVVASADALAAAQLPWEASRLAGQAAIRTTDASLARRLLERARELSSAEVATPAETPDGQAAGLSDREVEVARMVLAGATYREIGARLFISPKTVEHHIARIRTKVGATTRAEFVAALREVLDPT